MIAILMAAAAASVSPGHDMAVAFSRYCIDAGASPDGILARARRDGWQPGISSSGQPVLRDPRGKLTLRSSETHVADERMEGCSVAADHDVAGLFDAIVAMLGFAPAFHMGGSATFLGLHDRIGWRASSRDDRPGFARAKAAGDVYSVMVNEGAGGSNLMALNLRPATAP